MAKNLLNSGMGTKAVHAGVEPDPVTGAIMTPIYQTSTYVQESPGKHKGYEYSRTHNPTRTAVEESIAALEGGAHGICFSSGLAAIDAMLKSFKAGDEIVAGNDLYGGTYRIFMNVYANFGVKFRFVDMSDMDTLEAALSKQTKMVWIETPTNPLLRIIDIAAVAQRCKAKNIPLAVDNTFATPYLQKPMDLGADIVMHSMTKYLGGHSDTVMGAMVTNDDTWAERLRYMVNATGLNPGPMDSFLMLRGIKTLHVRMERHCENAASIASFLKDHPKVGKVYYPGLEEHAGHAIAAKQMSDFGGMVSFSLKGDDLEQAIDAMKSVKLFSLAESLGGVESLCTHPASMTHAAIPKAEREKNGLKDSLIRLSVGIESVDDLIEDLNQAIR